MKTIVLIPDLQCPQHDPKAVKVSQQLIRTISPDTVVFLGDVIAADSVSRYEKKTWKEAQLKFEEEVESTNGVLDSYDEVFKESGVKKVYLLEGNHDRRILIWVLKVGLIVGEEAMASLTIQNQLRLKDRKYEFVRQEQQPLKINHFNLLHGYYVNQYHAAKHMRKTGRNCFYGHAHDFQVYTSDHFEDDEPRMAMSCGCLCKYRQDFMQGAPTSWMQGITVINYDNDSFTGFFLPIIKYKCIYNGKVHKA